MNLSLHWKKLKACFSFLSQTFPLFFHLSTCLLTQWLWALHQSFQYQTYWVIDNVVLNFCNDFTIAKIGTWKWCKTFLLNYIAELSLYLQHSCGKTDQKQTNTYPGVKSKIYLAWLIIKPNLLNWVVLCTIKDYKIEFLYTFSLKRMKTVIIPKSSQKIKVKVLHVNCSRDSLKLPNYKFHVV